MIRKLFLSEINTLDKYNSEHFSLFRKALEENKYEFEYTFEKNNTQFSFFAFLKKEYENNILLPKCVNFKVNFDESPELLVKRLISNDEYDITQLLSFLIASEENKTREEILKQYYPTDEDTVKILMDIPNDFIKTVIDSVQLDDYNKVMQFYNHMDRISPINFSLLFKHTHDDYYQVYVYAKYQNKEFEIARPKLFFDVINMRLDPEKFEINIPKETLQAMSEDNFEILNAVHKIFDINSAHSFEVAHLLALSRNKNVYFETLDNKFSIPYQPTEAEFHIDNESKEVYILPYIETTEDTTYFAYNNILFLLDGNKLSSYAFEGKNTAKLAESCLKSRYVENEDAYRKIHDFLISSIKQGGYDTDNLKIDLFIDLIDHNQTLCISTKYSKDGLPLTYTELYSKDRRYPSFLGYITSLAKFGLTDDCKTDDEVIIDRFLKSDLTEIKKYATIYLGKNLKKLRKVKKVSLNLNIKPTNGGVFEATLFSKEYTDEQIKNLIKAYKDKKQYVILDDQFISLSDEEVEKEFEKYVNLNLEKELVNERLNLIDILKLNFENSGELNLSFEENVEKIFNEIVNYKDCTLSEDDLAKLSNLRDYQIDAVKWMLALAKHNLGGILADDMGLGKTIEAICYCALSKEENSILVTAPKSTLYNWKNEFNTFYPEIEVFIIEGSKENRKALESQINKKQKSVYLCSYDCLRSDIDLLKKIEFSTCIVDEAQFIKNSYALKTIAVKNINAKHKFALTGTPIENSLADLWSIFDLLMPNYFETMKFFLFKYSQPKNQKELAKKIQPFILRRTKKEVLKSLPQKTTEYIHLNMDKTQKDIYASIQFRAMSSFVDKSESLKVLAAINKLRQVCLDPSLVEESYDGIPPKFDFTVSLIKNSIANNHKILVFSFFKTALIKLKHYLEKENIESFLLVGETSSKDRLKICDNINNKDDVKVVLISLKAGGTGINLQGADIVIHLDPWWNLAAEEQATDRAYRIGQVNPVSVYKLVCTDSIEEKIIKLQQSKRDLFDKFIVSESQVSDKLTLEDFKYLLSN